MVNELLMFNRAYRQHLDACLLLYPNCAGLKAAREEVEQLYLIWDAVRDARCDYYHIHIRRQALKKLREHLKAISFHNPGRWFKADLVRGGVTIRLFEKQSSHEIMVCQTDQSDKLLAAVDRPDFRARLVEELIRQGFPIEKGIND